jgi:hypothetical protein
MCFGEELPVNVTHQAPPRPATPVAPHQAPGNLIKAVVGIIGLAMIGLGVWSFADPASFASAVLFPEHTHFLHDIGAFQIGIGVTLVLALLWEDSIAVALGGFFTGNTLHVVSHVMDLHLGGRPTDWMLLGAVSVVSLVALLIRLRQVVTARAQTST